MPRVNKKIDPQTMEKLCAELEQTSLAEKAPMLRAQGNCPLVEDIKGDPKHKLVTFFYYDDTGKWADVKVTSLGFCSSAMDISKKIVHPPQEDPTILKKSEIPYILLERLAQNIFTATVILPAEACISYSVDVPLRQDLDDPLNSRSFQFQTGSFPRSVLDLSLAKNDFTETPALNPKRLRRYSVDTEGVINERAGNYHPSQNERMFSAYLPEKFDETDKTTTYPMRLFLDGKWYLNDQAAAILEKSSEVDTIDIMLEPMERVARGENKDYANRDFEYLPANHPKLSIAGFEAGIEAFTGFLSGKFIPSVQEKLNISKEPNDLTVCGSSLSGFAAVYIGVNCQEAAIFWQCINPISSSLD